VFIAHGMQLQQVTTFGDGNHGKKGDQSPKLIREIGDTLSHPVVF